MLNIVSLNYLLDFKNACLECQPLSLCTFPQRERKTYFLPDLLYQSTINLIRIYYPSPKGKEVNVFAFYLFPHAFTDCSK